MKATRLKKALLKDENILVQVSFRTLVKVKLDL